jgi:hypothetical protein
MINIFGREYYINLENIDKICKVDCPPTDVAENVDPNIEYIKIFLYEIIKLCIERILNDNEINDEDLGSLSQKDTTISFRLAFNTLLKYDILIDNYDE